ncbi:4-hydroxythreonine-4-phosphate dehydrogenase PdxA [Bradyrhizobium canariense]|uniref:4-hydroxythreonine-4-phosphate dehydrogenase n=1 Tax=Bradyrhizobium canariense TaxID=255045 RepID=A0A1H1RG00_9BRAD|nr:4-hydroxythreonine-4-phosphate dehydrogenase PdxA [Bradyrhizobium canariense]SDS34717.1 4-hydroxythreonine-4-phosphate dehydrogenase [Bradyrhizobium canariense]
MAKPLALTLGEPAGIGPDITIKAWLRRSELRLPPFYLLGDCGLLRDRAKTLGLDVRLAEVRAEDAFGAFADALPVVATGSAATAQPGQPDGTSAEAAIVSIRQAVGDVIAGRASAVVTNPIAKSVLYRAGFQHPGHTEFLAELAATGGRAPQPVMMLWSPALAVVPVTIHLPLRDAITQLSSDLIVTTVRIVAAAMKARFGLANPRIALSGLNPHAGEDGSLGTEEQRIVTPAVETLRAEGIEIRGPLPADTMFHDAARKTYDCAICMYHDQALIPIKTLAFDDAVNVTLGLPFVRTSPDHGTAFDIAGTGRANPSSLIAALQLAARMAAATPA